VNASPVVQFASKGEAPRHVVDMHHNTAEHCPLPLFILQLLLFLLWAKKDDMEEKDVSRAREEWMRREGQAHEAVLAMLKKLDTARESDEPKRFGSEENWPLPNKESDTQTARIRRRIAADSSVPSEIRRTRRMGKFVEHLPSEEEMEEVEEAATESVSEDDKADWRLSQMGPRVLSYEPAPWEQDNSPTRNYPSSTLPRSSSSLVDIMEGDEERYRTDSENSTTRIKPDLLTPPPDFAFPTATGYFPSTRAPPSPLSPKTALSPILESSDSARTPPAAPKRKRAGLKKIFLSTLRPKKRDDIEPLSPTPTFSSTATSPSLPTPTIRITSPFAPRRFDGSPIFSDDHPMLSKLSPIETKYKLPELRLSRADWSEWGRQVAERL